MQESVAALVRLGKIPDDAAMPDDLFRQYDSLIQDASPLTFEEAEALIGLFSDDCEDLNWGLLHLIETVVTAYPSQAARYRVLIAECSNAEFRELLEMRLNNLNRRE